MNMQLTSCKGSVTYMFAVVVLAAAVSLTPVGIFACGLTISGDITLQQDLVG